MSMYIGKLLERSYAISSNLSIHISIFKFHFVNSILWVNFRCADGLTTLIPDDESMRVICKP
jgi:hypothetical protein